MPGEGLQTPSGETESTAGHDGAVYRCDSFHEREIFNKLEDFNLDVHSISWSHWDEEPHVADRSQHQELSRLRSGSGCLREKNGSRLSDRLYNQGSRHHGVLREVA